MMQFHVFWQFVPALMAGMNETIGGELSAT